jgi:hypothetical protein
VNAYWEAVRFELPELAGWEWRRFADTSLASPHDIAEPGHDIPLAVQSDYEAGPRSGVILVAGRRRQRKTE